VEVNFQEATIILLRWKLVIGSIRQCISLNLRSCFNDKWWNTKFVSEMRWFISGWE